MSQSLPDRIRSLTEFEFDRECGYWSIPIDDVNGELAIDPERVARHVDVFEAEPIKKHITNLRPLLELLPELAEALEKCTDHNWGTADLDMLAKLERIVSELEGKL